MLFLRTGNSARGGSLLVRGGDAVPVQACPAWPAILPPAIGRCRIRPLVQGTQAQRRRAFLDAYPALENRIKIFVALPIDELDLMALERKVDDLGRIAASQAKLP